MSLDKATAEALALVNETLIRLNDTQAALAAAVSADDKRAKTLHLKRAHTALNLVPRWLGKSIAKVDECGTYILARTVIDALIVDGPMDTSRHPTARDYPAPTDAA